jgi:organic hydroperoxide reductase OsmC/OhrA
MGIVHKPHHYAAELEWTGAAAGPTRDYRGYSREHVLRLPGKPELRLSSDPAFVGDPALHNPEDLLLAAIASCHMLSWLSLCARQRIVASAYRDTPEATMTWVEDTYAFTEVRLKPRCVISADSDVALAMALHEEAHHVCFIARSVNFPIRCQADIARAPAIP